MIRCLSAAKPEALLRFQRAHAVRCLLRRRFPHARLNVTVGRRWFWGGTTLKHFANLDPSEFSGPSNTKNDDAAIIFTTGSTGPPKGVLYQHQNFIEQASQIQSHYQIESGGADLSAFPLFALYNAAMGKTTVIPDMDATKPAEADPVKIIRAINDWKTDQSFGSPALWNTVARYCQANQVKLPTLQRIFSAGAPVPIHVLRRLKEIIAEDGDIYTPYGATESLPVASNSATQVLSETFRQTEDGAGVCVGHRFSGIQWRVIQIDDGPCESIEKTKQVPAGEIGELMVQGPVVTRRYVTRTDANALHKVADGDSFWHRMGDIGYLDDQDRFWFCGRKSHRVETGAETMFTVRCEAICNNHSEIYRSALVGVGKQGSKTPVMIAEPWPEHYSDDPNEQSRLIRELKELAAKHPLTQSVKHFFIRKALPVDIRHNAKIFREQLAVWAAKKLEVTSH